LNVQTEKHVEPIPAVTNILDRTHYALIGVPPTSNDGISRWRGLKRLLRFMANGE